MALGKSSRMDSRRSSPSYCSTTTVAVFVALCLVVVWLMTSSPAAAPAEALDGKPVTFEDTSVVARDDAKRGVVDTSSDESNSVPERRTENPAKSDEETSNDSEDMAKKGGFDDSNGNAEGEGEGGDDQEKSTENPVKGNEETINDSEDTSKKRGYNDLNGNAKGRDSSDDQEKTTENPAKSDEDMSNDSEDSSKKRGYNDSKEGVKGGDKSNSDDQKRVAQNDSDGTDSNKEEKDSEQNSDKGSSDAQEKALEQNSKGSGDEEKPDNKSGQEEKSDAMQEGKKQGRIGEKEKPKKDREAKGKAGNQTTDLSSNEMNTEGMQSELLNETNTQNGSWSTQATESRKEKETQGSSSPKGQTAGYSWKLCNNTAGADYIPCLDNVEAIKKLTSTKHYEHRERHCPKENPTCLVPLPQGYKRPIEWPTSRDKIWYHNVPHPRLAEVKGHQNWVKVSGECLTFPGGGTQFKRGALHYIDFIQEALPDIAWGKRTRVVLDVGCGVASFGGYIFERDVLTMSVAPKDEHEAQVQFALERGIPAISAVMGTKRLPFPSKVFDVVHCARCRVPWHIEGGKLLLELNRLIRPGGYFVWSATPVYQKLEEDVEIWEAMSALTKSMCWKMVNKTKDPLNRIGLAIYKKPANNKCYEKRTENSPPLCKESDDPNAAWNVPLQACMHKLPVDPAVRGSKWPEPWPQRLEKTPYWLNSSQVGVYGKPAPQDFEADYKHWKRVVSTSYLKGMGINWSTVRNVMDMRSVYGGFAAALRDMKLWVMNVVSIDSPDTLPVIYERGLFGMYHDWCESFSTYPRTYDLLHADHLFSKLKERCKLLGVFAEVDRMLRPEGKLIVRDNAETISEIEDMAKSMQWEIKLTYSKENDGLLCVQKTTWRPKEIEKSTS